VHSVGFAGLARRIIVGGVGESFEGVSALSIGLRLNGQAPRRGLMRRPAAPNELAAQIEAWLRSEAPDVVRSVLLDAEEASAVLLRASFHPAAPDVEIRLGGAGRVAASAPTSAMGPGYHTWISRLFRRLRSELSIDWRPSKADAPPEDDTGYFRTDDRVAAQRGHLRWLHAELQRIADPRSRRRGPVHLGSFPGHRFEIDAALVTSLGPRSAEWLTGALASPRQAIDVWPWAADAMDARYLLDRCCA